VVGVCGWRSAVSAWAARSGTDRVQYACAAALKVLWGGMFLVWLAGAIERGWVAAVIWLVFADGCARRGLIRRAESVARTLMPIPFRDPRIGRVCQFRHTAVQPAEGGGR
jgi:hypothetical protein